MSTLDTGFGATRAVYRRPGTGGSRATEPGPGRPAGCGPGVAAGSGDGDRGVEVDVLDGVDQRGALVGRPLEGLAADDEPGAAGPLVDHRGAHGLGQVVGALGLPARVDEADPPGVAVDDLPAGEVDRVVGGQLAVDQRVGLAELRGRCSRRCSRAASA